MKRIVVIGMVLFFNISCEEETRRGELILRIKENKVSCTGYEGQTECFLVQQGNAIGSDDWKYFYESIDGFIYEPGFVYKLLVTTEIVKDPPEDAPPVKYKLLRELSKQGI